MKIIHLDRQTQSTESAV